MNIINLLRKNVGTIIAALGFLILCIMTFGDLGELSTEAYWENVKNNLTSISFVTVGLTFVQVSIKQGLAEQALQRGLNTEITTAKYEEHKEIVKRNNDKIIYLPYFLQIYNQRHTLLSKREFLVNNGFISEAALLSSGQHALIEKYKRIRVNVTAASLKWSTIEIVYNENGRIMTLDEHRIRRIISSVIKSFIVMIGVTFVTGGLFFTPSEEPLWQKFVKLFSYIIAIAIGAVFDTVKEYEKGAFSVPNELDEINQIWYEFECWAVPDWVKEEINQLNNELANMEVNDGQARKTFNEGADISEKQDEGENLSPIGTNIVLSTPGIDGAILNTDITE